MIARCIHPGLPHADHCGTGPVRPAGLAGYALARFGRFGGRGLFAALLAKWAVAARRR
jgi:hypothetical protein